MAEAVNARNSLERAVKSEYGKKRSGWPAEANERLRAAEERAALATVGHLYGQNSDHNWTDSVADIKAGFTGAGLRSRQRHVNLVDTTADAHVIVELRGRRSTAGSGGLFGRHHLVLFAVKAGPMLTAERFAAVPRNYDHGGLVARSRSEAGECLWQALGSGSWKVAGSVVAALVDQFIETHHDVLVGPPAER